ncbi:mucin-2-like [Neocloeon triangulifer]|uniref:mucin-2-like n=1 Tax=Neocloeon triangulifer TaxID=2078957 RepID=UPI00286F18DC|nr:mucin-2-like [Neocloeon triangulifer]
MARTGKWSELTVILVLVVFAKETLSAGLPLKFVTSPTQKPITYFEDPPLVVNRHTKPLTHHDGDKEIESFLGGSSSVGSWKRWDHAASAKPAAQPAATNEKTFTQQQILEKLFADYHNHLEEQKKQKKSNTTEHGGASADQGRYVSSINIRPKPTPTQTGHWALDIEESTKVLNPSSAMANLKLHRPGTSNTEVSGRPPKDGWVSLEPIPWSSSKISKWTPNKATSSSPTAVWNTQMSQKPFWSTNQQQQQQEHQHRPSQQTSSSVSNWDLRPSSSDNRPLNWDDLPGKPNWSDTLNRPSWDNNKPSWTEANVKPSWSSSSSSSSESAPNKPTWAQTVSNKPSLSGSSSSWTDLSSKPSFANTNRPSSFSGTRPSKPPPSGHDLLSHHLGIITDGKLPEWPIDTPASSSFTKPAAHKPTWNRPTQSVNVQSGFSGFYKGEDELKNNKPPQAEESAEGGRWVLLSSTRGQTIPPGGRGQGSRRAFKFNPTVSMSTNRGIRLTVLPAANGTSTVSHGGLLEVDKTFETVDNSAIKLQQQQQQLLSQQTQVAPIKPIISADSVVVVAAPAGAVAPTSPKGGHKKKGNKKGGNKKKRKGGKKKRKGHRRPGQSAQQQAGGGGGGGGGGGVSGVQVFSATNPNDYVNRRKALIAAIGAGMLPATMAALVPMFLGRRRRRRDLTGDMSDTYVKQYINKIISRQYRLHQGNSVSQ